MTTSPQARSVASLQAQLTQLRAEGNTQGASYVLGWLIDARKAEAARVKKAGQFGPTGLTAEQQDQANTAADRATAAAEELANSNIVAFPADRVRH